MTLEISIHAPVWGATMATETLLSHNLISIHAPVWGATLLHLFHSKNF